MEPYVNNRIYSVQLITDYNGNLKPTIVVCSQPQGYTGALLCTAVVYKSMEARHVDNLLVAMGNPGRFQVLTFLLLGGCYVLNVCNSIAPVFYLAKTRHHCKVDNISLVPAVIKNNEKKQDSCTVYLAFNTSKTIPCRNGWDYHLEEGESTIISEVW